MFLIPGHLIDWVTPNIAIACLEGGIQEADKHAPNTTVICLLGNISHADVCFDLTTPPFTIDQMDTVARTIQQHVSQGHRVIVHCGGGIERSPLAVAWWLWRYNHAKTIDEAYDLVMSRRPQAQRRTAWVAGLGELLHGDPDVVSTPA